MIKIHMKIKLLKKISFFMSFCLLAFCCIACENGVQTEFPEFLLDSTIELSSETSEIDVISDRDNKIESEPIHLTVASTLSSDQLNELARLYTAKIQQTGIKTPDFSSEYLETVVPNFTVESISTPLDGVKMSDIEKWNKMPDILYVNGLHEPLESKLIKPITEYAAENSSLSPTVLATSALNSLTIDGQLYGIPFRTSATLLFSNIEILEKAGLQGLPVNLDIDMFMETSEAIFDALTKEIIPDPQEIDDENPIKPDTEVVSNEDHEIALRESIYPFYFCRELFPIFSSSFDSDFGWFARQNNLFFLTSDAFSQAVSFLRNYAVLGYSLDHLSSSERQIAFGDEDPRITGRTAMWVGDTKDLEKLSEKQSVFLSQIPSSPEQFFSPPALTLYPLCISADTQYPELAADFAVFLALDEQALIYQFQNDENSGYFPTIDSETLWMSAYSENEHLDMFLFLRENLDHAYYNPYSSEASIYNILENIFERYNSALLDNSSDLEGTLISMQNELTP